MRCSHGGFAGNLEAICIYDNDLRYKQIQNKMMNMPQWTKAEHMEMSVPEKEL